MIRSAACLSIAALVLPATGNAQLRRQPSSLPPPVAPSPVDVARGDRDMRPQDRWDRTLRQCLNDRHQSKRERRRCANSGMPPRR